ncbi:MAG: 6-phosphogluconate dehydrogenase [Patescibacteria group bacterium]|jgi:6-phosphogluconate dehydrogenase
MGSLMAQSLLRKKYKVIVHNRSPKPIKKLVKKGATPAYTIEEVISKHKKERIIMIMVTAGKPVDAIIYSLIPFLSKGDIIIDAGNSFYKDSIKRYKDLKKRGINFIDMGTSGGLTGALNGASLMIGGDKPVFTKIEKLFRDLAVKNGYAYLGPSGAGHYVKTIHNGIEYAILEAYAEGYGILNKSPYKLNYADVSKVWSNGSVIRSWITELAQKEFKKHNKLAGFKGIIGGGQTGKWALEIAKKQKNDTDTLEHAIKKRKSSMKTQSFATKFVSAIRHAFGGHNEP